MKLLCCALVMFAFSAFAATPRVPQDVLSNAFETVPIPDRWIPKQLPTTIASAAEYPRGEIRSTKLTDFIATYGRPTRLVRPRSGSGNPFLIYSLKGGYNILVWVPSIDSDRFLAAQLYRLDGEREGPFLK